MNVDDEGWVETVEERVEEDKDGSEKECRRSLCRKIEDGKGALEEGSER